jgi:hypothetical protein
MMGRKTILTLAALAGLCAAAFAPPVARPAAAAETRCMAAIQGKVAWNRAGDKNWDAANLQRLCDSTTLEALDSTVACFRREIQRYDDWERATDTCTEGQRCPAAIQGKVAWNRAGDKNWEPGNLRRLCESTSLVDATIECFRKEIQKQDDWDRATRTCTEGRHEVEVLYVVPKDKQARPDIEKALAAIMAVTQRHYFEQLGVTFKLKTPLVQIVHIDETSDAFSKEGAILNRCTDLGKNRFKADYMYKENALICLFEADTESAGGSFNLVALPIWVWGRGYDAFRKDADSDLSKVLVLGAVSHEMGYSFGLMHTEDARSCFKKGGVDLGTLPNLIMQNKDDPRHVSVYDVPFLPQEKRLLLDPNYLPDCRPFIKDRPHASWHLRHPLPPDNPAAARPAVNGRNVKKVRYADGVYRVSGPTQWVEEDRNGGFKFNYSEEKRDGSAVFLSDPWRSVRLMLDVKQGKVFVSKGAAEFSPLFTITDSSAADSPRPQTSTPAMSKRFVMPTGYTA